MFPLQELPSTRLFLMSEIWNNPENFSSVFFFFLIRNSFVSTKVPFIKDEVWQQNGSLEVASYTGLSWKYRLDQEVAESAISKSTC